MADKTGPLTMESAVGMLIEKNSAAPKEDNSAPAGDDSPPASDAAAEPNTDSPSADTADATGDDGKTDAPSDDEGKTDGDGEDQGDSHSPPIEPPPSWKTEEKAVWESLPREAQEAIARREQDRTTELRKLQNESAEKRKTVDAEVTRLKELSTELARHADEQLNDLAREFADIRSEADVVTLAQRDPARYTVFQARLMQFQAKTAVAQKAINELSKRVDTERQEQINKAKDVLLEAFPKWKTDPELARKEVTELQDYVVKTYKVDEQAARQAFDPVLYQLAHKAMLYDRAQTKKDAAVERTPPRVVKPGTGNPNPKAADKQQARLNQLNKLSKSGDIEDARGLLRM